MLHLRAFSLCFPLSAIGGHNQWLMGTRLQSPRRSPFFMNCIFPPSLGSLCCFCSAIINLQFLLKWLQTWWITNQCLLCIEISTGLDPMISFISPCYCHISKWHWYLRSIPSGLTVKNPWWDASASHQPHGKKSAAGAKHQTEIQLALVTGNLTWIPQLQRWKWPMGIGTMLKLCSAAKGVR